MCEYDISVIIPVYNASKYLSECIESILSQTKDSIEIVIVDDGSSDSSLEIIEKFAKKNECISYCSQENAGVAKARAVGFRMSHGKYIGWIDADDVAKPEMYEKLYYLAISENADFVYCDYDYYPQKVLTKTKWFKEYKGVINADFIDRNTQCWNTLVLRELYEQVKIDELLLEYSELCWISAMVNARKIVYTPDKLYFYRVGHESLSGGKFEGRVNYYKKNADINKKLPQMLKSTIYERKLKAYWEYRYIYSLLLLLIVSAKNSDRKTYNQTRGELIRLRYTRNRYLNRFVSHNYGKLKGFVITRIVPFNYLVARSLVKATL